MTALAPGMTNDKGTFMTTAVVPIDQMHAIAKQLVASKMFGFKTEAEAMSIMLIAQAEGRNPALAARDYHVIQGRPALKADAMLARFQQEGGVVEWVSYTEAKVSGKFSHPQSSPTPLLVEWTLDMAKRAGLANRDNWRNYPRAMLRSRVISEGVRATYPGIAVGIYTVEEVQDMAKERDITPASGAADRITEEQRVRMADVADRVREWMNQGSLTDAFAEIDNAAPDPDEYVFLWTHFDSRVRRQLKEEGERQKIKNTKLIESSTINDAQKKRLEARIGELKLKRENVKAWCKEMFGKEHFADLTRSEYDQLDAQLDAWYGAQNPAAQAAQAPVTPLSDGQAPDAAGPAIDTTPILRAFGTLGYDLPQVEELAGLPLAEWTAETANELRDIYKARNVKS